MARISKPPAERRQEIIDTAYALFMQNGYEQTTVRDIVQSLGVAQGLFYYYFKSKEDVLLAAVEKNGQQLIEEIARIVATEETPPMERLRAVFSVVTDFLVHGYNTLFLPKVSAQLRANFEQQTRKQLLPYLNEMLREGQANGDFSVPYPEHTVRFILAGFIGLCTDADAPAAEEILPVIVSLAERILGLPENTLSQQPKE